MNARSILLAAALTGLGLGACSPRQDADTRSTERRELKIAPLKPEAPVAPPPVATAPKPKPPLANTIETAREPSLPPDAQVQEDAAAVGMTSRTASAGATAAPAERPSGMSNLY